MLPRMASVTFRRAFTLAGIRYAPGDTLEVADPNTLRVLIVSSIARYTLPPTPPRSPFACVQVADLSNDQSAAYHAVQALVAATSSGFTEDPTDPGTFLSTTNAG